MSSLSCLARVTLLFQNKLNQLYLVCMLGSSTPEYKDFQTSSNSYLFMGHDSTFLVFWVYQIVFFFVIFDIHVFVINLSHNKQIGKEAKTLSYTSYTEKYCNTRKSEKYRKLCQIIVPGIFAPVQTAYIENFK